MWSFLGATQWPFLHSVLCSSNMLALTRDSGGQNGKSRTLELQLEINCTRWLACFLKLVHQPRIWTGIGWRISIFRTSSNGVWRVSGGSGCHSFASRPWRNGFDGCVNTAASPLALFVLLGNHHSINRHTVGKSIFSAILPCHVTRLSGA